MNTQNSSRFKIGVAFSLVALGLAFQNCSPKSNPASAGALTCTGATCATSTYNLFVADLDGSNLSVIKTSSYQEMTHPRVAFDKTWVSYTTYNDIGSNGCAGNSNGYLNTEIRAIKLDGTGDKQIIAPVAGTFNTNDYWIGSTYQFTFVSGLAAGPKLFRSAVDSLMNQIITPIEIPVPSTIVPMDPHTHLASNKIVYPGLYNPGGGYVKSLFLQNLSDGSGIVGLTLGRDHSGTAIICKSGCTNIMENDPKISPDGTKVAFMRYAGASGANGFGWHIFVVPVSSPLTEVDISYSHIGSNIMKNDVLPEWIDNSTLLFSTIDYVSATNYTKSVYTMKADGTQRTKINLPNEFRYADVFPFTDANGKLRMILFAEKIGATCSH